MATNGFTAAEKVGYIMATNGFTAAEKVGYHCIYLARPCGKCPKLEAEIKRLKAALAKASQRR